MACPHFWRRLRQVESTVAMQALQPRIKEIQERYKGKPQDEMQVRCTCVCSALAL